MTRRTIEIETGEGTARASLFTPVGDAVSRAGVLLLMDIFGPRPALDQMAERLADQGYFVLVPDLFYRFGERGAVDAATAFKDPEVGPRLREMLGATTQAMTASDAGAFIAALEQAGATGPIGVVGYCMGGGRALTVAARYPEKVAAAASFHGGNLASEAPDSPHLGAASIRGRVYVGNAFEDGSFPTEQSARLVEAFHRAKVDFTFENYVGVAHGWCIPDHVVHDKAGAERHWRRLTAFFAETLAVF